MIRNLVLALSILVSTFAQAAAEQVSEAEARIFGVADAAVDMSSKFDFSNFPWGWLFIGWAALAGLVVLFFMGVGVVNRRYDGKDDQDNQNSYN